MYGDLKITNSGDLVISSGSKNNSLKVSFAICKTKSLKVSFALVGFYDSSEALENTLRISFDLKQVGEKYTVPVIIDRDFMKQLAVIKLKTVKGEIFSREEFGSLIHSMKYKYVDKVLVDKLKNLVYAELKEDIPNLMVDVNLRSNGYMSAIVISLKDNIGKIGELNIER